MIQQFLKAGGVRTIEEFYKKFPTEGHFNAYMKMGGGLYAYQPGGQNPPSKQDVGDPYYQQQVAEQQAALPVAAKMPGSVPFAPPITPQPTYGDYMRDVMSGKQRMTVPSMPASPEEAATIVPYSGTSIVDFLKAQGKSSAKSDRKELAAQLGIDNYTGTAAQNTQMLRALQENPDYLSDYQDAPMPGKSKSKQTPGKYPVSEIPEMLKARAFQQPTIPFMNGPAVGPGGIAPTDNTGLTTGEKVGIGTGIVATLGTVGLTVKDLMDRKWESMPLAPALKRKLTIAKKLLLKEATGIAGIHGEAAAVEFLKSPKKMQAILDNLDKMEISGGIYNTESGTAMRNLEAWKMNKEAAAENLFANYKNTGELLQDAAEEAKILKSWNAQKAAAIRWGKPVPKFPSLPSKAGAATEEAGLLRRAYQAAAETPWLRRVGEFIKKAPKLQEGGEDPDSLGEDILEVFDPTGISSWDDAYRAWTNPDASWWDRGLATFSAIPLIGEFGRVGKGVNTAVKMAKPVSNTRKVINAAGKGLHYLSGNPAMKFLEHYNPAARFATTMTGSAVRNFPKLAQGTLRLANDFGRTERLYNAAGHGLRTAAGPAPSSQQAQQGEPLRLIRPDGSVINTTTADPRVADWMHNNAIDTAQATGWDPAREGWRLKPNTPYNYKKEGGDYSGTYSAGVYYKNGGSKGNQWGGSVFQKGGEYDLSEDQIQDLIDKGYKIEYI